MATTFASHGALVPKASTARSRGRTSRWCAMDESRASRDSWIRYRRGREGAEGQKLHRHCAMTVQPEPLIIPERQRRTVELAQARLAAFQPPAVLFRPVRE